MTPEAEAAHPEPFELWQQADGDRDHYLALMVEHGHIVPNEPCGECGQTFRHRHDPLDPDRAIRTDIFGHDEPGILDTIPESYRQIEALAEAEAVHRDSPPDRAALKADIAALGTLTPEEWDERRGGDPIARTINAVWDIIDAHFAVVDGVREAHAGSQSAPSAAQPIASRDGEGIDAGTLAEAIHEAAVAASGKQIEPHYGPFGCAWLAEVVAAEYARLAAPSEPPEDRS